MIAIKSSNSNFPSNCDKLRCGWITHTRTLGSSMTPKGVSVNPLYRFISLFSSVCNDSNGLPLSLKKTTVPALFSYGEDIELDFRLTIGLRKIGNQWTITHEHHSIPATK